MYLNNVVVSGRLTKDPELRFTPNGVAVATFTLAINRPFKNANNETEADFINVVVWRRPAENAANFLKKGSVAGVVGRVQTRSYEGQDGKRVYVTEIMAESVQFGAKNESSTNGGGNNQNANTGQQRTNRDGDPFAGGGQIDISDDDLPF